MKGTLDSQCSLRGSVETRELWEAFALAKFGYRFLRCCALFLRFFSISFSCESMFQLALVHRSCNRTSRTRFSFFLFSSAASLYLQLTVYWYSLLESDCKVSLVSSIARTTKEANLPFISTSTAFASRLFRMDRLPTELLISITGKSLAIVVFDSGSRYSDLISSSDHIPNEYGFQAEERQATLAILVRTCKRFRSALNPILYESPLLRSSKQARKYLRTFTGWIIPFSIARGLRMCYIRPRIVAFLSSSFPTDDC